VSASVAVAANASVPAIKRRLFVARLLHLVGMPSAEQKPPPELLSFFVEAM